MSGVKYATGIDIVRGLLAKPKVKDGHSCGTYLLATHRTAPTQSNQCARLYIKEADAYKRTTPVTADEIAARLRFKTVAGMVKTRKKDLSKMSEDQANFLEQKNRADGKKTMKAYLWSVCGQEYDAQHA